MLRIMLACALVAAAVCGGARADVITLWDFQDHSWDPVFQDWLVDEELTPETGSGTWELLGGVALDQYQEDYRDPDNPGEITSSTDPIHQLFEFMGFALDTDDYPAQGTANRTAGAQFNVSTAGYTNIRVKFDIRHKEESARHTRVQYTVNGTDWIDSTLFEADNPFSADHWYWREVDLSDQPGVADNPNFAFRVVAEFAPGTSGYAPAFTGIEYAQDGLRWDMVQVIGDPVGAARAAGISNAAAAHAAETPIGKEMLFRVWGRAAVQDADTLTLDDGSGNPLKVVASGHGVRPGEYVQATGFLMSGPPVWLQASAPVKRLD